MSASRSTSGPVVAAAARIQFRLEDLGAPLDETPEQREVLALGHALVAARPRVLQRQRIDPSR